MKRFERGFTLVELMMATLLTLMLMLVVVGLFAAVSQSIRNSRATMEMAGRLRAAKRKLQLDLEGRTVTVSPPVRPAAGEGYLEIIEGPLGPLRLVWTVDPTTTVAYNEDTGSPDTTVADFDDILMFTTRSRAGPFVGRYQNGTISSYEAEVAWFVRDRTLYRRVLLIAPQVISDPAVDTNGNSVIDSVDLTDSNGNVHSFYQWYDISARPEGYDTSTTPGRTYWVPNTLGDLTKRENRFAHRWHATLDVFPYDVRNWCQPTLTDPVAIGLPTLRETSHPNWMDWPNLNPGIVPTVAPVAQVDLWNNPHPWDPTVIDPLTGTLLAYQGDRIGEDVILTNVIGFDVKVWDPGAPRLRYQGRIIQPGDPGFAVAFAAWLGGTATLAGRGAYVDLNYAGDPTVSTFSGPGNRPLDLPMVYDTWSFHYEHDGISQDDDDGDGAPGGPGDLVDEGTNGFDDDGNGIVDDLFEREAIAPYPVPLRGIQIKIRTFEPDSRQVREVTVVADFSPK